MKAIKKFFRRKKIYISSECGHETLLYGRIVHNEQGIDIEMPLGKDGKPEYCLDCISKMSIRCTWCGDTIFIGEQVTLYALVDNTEFEIPSYAKKYNDEDDSGNQRYIGCLSRQCCMSGADMQGRWVPSGKVERFLSPIEKCLMNGGTEPVIISDVSAYNG